MPEIDMNPDSKKAAWALLRDYNLIAAEFGLPEVKKFSDRSTGLKCLTAMRQRKLAKASSPSTPETQLNSETTNPSAETEAPAVETEAPAVEVEATSAEAPAVEVQPASSEVSTKRGRGKSLSGLILWATDKCTAGNPRREGSWGQKSLQIIINNPGLTLEEFLIRGGRTNDLRWDIQHGNVISEVNPK